MTWGGLRRVRRAWLGVLACACTPPPASDAVDTEVPADTSLTDTERPDTDAPDTDPPDTDPPDTDPPDTDDTDPADPTAPSTLGGAIEEVDGGALGVERVLVRYCRPAGCFVADQSVSGRWSFLPQAPGLGSIEVVDVAGDEDRFATYSVPYTLPPGQDVTIDVVAPRLGPALALPSTASAVALHPDLRLTVAASQLRSNDGLGTRPSTAAAVEVLPSQLPVVQGLPGPVLAGWLIVPFDHLSTVPTGLPIAVRDRWERPDGELELWVSIYDEGRWERIGALASDGLGFLVPDGKLPRTGTLVVVEP